MRILYTNSHPDRSESAMFKSIMEEGHAVHAAVDPTAIRLEQLKAQGVPLTTIRFDHKIDLKAISSLRTVISEHQPEIIHTFSKRSLTNALIATRGTDIPVIGYRGIIGNIHPWSPESRLVYFSRRLKKIICVCHAVEHSLAAIGIDPDKTVTIHKGHDISWYNPAPRSSLAAFNIPDEAFVVGCAARMRPRKGIDVLVKAVAELQDPEIHLLLVGEITDTSIEKVIAGSNLSSQVHAVGFRRDASELMGACDVFAMPSLRREGLPRAVIEAMAQATVPLVTDVGGMPELVRNEQDGLVVPPGNVEALKDGLTRLKLNETERKTFASSAKQRIVQSFDINATVAKTLSVYESIAG